MFHKPEEEISANWKEKKPLVSICCITYNHEKYIEETLNGFLMQETRFSFEILIHDDASTDNTAEIIRRYQNEYPDLVQPIYQTENQKSKFGNGMNPRFNYPRAKGKYIALCEGDDYWTDPRKLEMQVDFLEENQDCSMVFTGCILHKSTGERKRISYGQLRAVNAAEYLTSNYFMTTASLMFHGAVIDLIKEKWMWDAFAGDFILKYCALSMGNIGHIPNITCVYNKGSIGSWSKRILTKKLILKEFSDNLRGLYFLDKNCNLPPKIINLKIKKLTEIVLFKMSLQKGGLLGLFFIMKNIRRLSFYYVGSYIKRALNYYI